ncbi:MAG: hypothetical protein BMS9Abin04_278 [Planctomycetia bacterium]|nr:MAG: hypothetical protein BMS9Abin04_278 [Planctomycetia bacterium]
MTDLALVAVPTRQPSRATRAGRTILASALVLLAGLAAKAAAADQFMIKAMVQGDFVEGQPLSWSKSIVRLLARDGQMVTFRPSQATEYRKTSTRFYSYPTGQIRSKLYAEFGNRFEVTGTGHYLVVHPRGQKDRWAERFEKLYRSFYHYFQVRGFKLSDPKFPLIAVVFPKQDDYRRYRDRTGLSLGPNILGHYDPRTNRISLFDLTVDNPSLDWSRNAETIIHEATHQTAFNTGIHRRFADAPRWVCEGLATMFEARGVWDSLSGRSAPDRVNRDRLASFRRYADTRRKAESLSPFIATDQIFSRDQEAAYAEAWALSFYLSETRPRRYSAYLARTAARTPFSAYPAAERLADFQEVFGDNLKMFEVQFLRYLKRVR